jgi:phenylacetate-CoA ligase
MKGDLSQLKNLSKDIVESIRTVTGIKANIVLVPYNSLPRFEGKAKRVKDLRKDVAF